jgi:outer membrane protein OmpA-like peptidoglycan-associated protein
MSSRKVRSRIIELWGPLAAASLLPALALANGVNVQTFTPNSGMGYVLSETGGPERIGPDVNPDSYRRYFLGFNYNFLNTPLVELDESGLERTDTLIDSIQTFNLMAGIEWDGRFSLNADLPVSLVGMPGTSQQFAAGDIRIFPKLYMSDPGDVFQFALIPEMRINSGDPALFTSEDGISWGVSMAIERDFGPLAMAINFGYRNSPYATFEDLDYRHRIPVSLSLNVPMSPEWAFNGEAAAQPVVPFSNDQNPSELYAGLNYRPSREVAIMGGAALGSFNRVSSGDFRAVVGLRFSPIQSDPLPKVETAQAAPPQPKIIEKIVYRQSAPIVKLVPTPARVVFTPREIEVKEEVLFINNSDRLTAHAKGLLKEVASVMKENRKRFRKIRIEGHTNEVGADGYNLELSKRRATAVKKYLSSQGIESAKLDAVGFGKRKPKVTAASGVSKDMRLVLNRRVQFKVVN